MKLTTKIKLTKATGYIELVIAVIMMVISFLSDALRLKAIIMGLILLIIGFVFVRYPEYISGGGRK